MVELLDDKLSRKNEAKFLINYLTKRYEVKNNEDSFVLNVNAKWGYGKTFFLKLLEEELKKKEHEVIFFDAWKNDFTKEPLLAFFSEINDSLSDYFNNSKNSEAKRIFKLTFSKSLPLFVSILTKHLTGLSAEEFTQLLSEEDVKSDDEEKSEIKKDTQNTLSSIMSKATEIALQEHKTLKNSIETFKKNMKLLISQIEKDTNPKLPLFILIDELDRCRPNYAIELLENIKHIFDIKGIYFIIATNSKQLSHSINAIYGANFSSEIYLKRFFDQEYSLKEPDKYEYIKNLLEREVTNQDKIINPLSEEDYPQKNLHVILIDSFSKYFKLQLRDIHQSINTLSTITLTWDD
ncbi:MAG: P-loop NTPase fold protein, partial [Poseidonibacter sp.]|uniref:KAP family P-loop NTPase fold protein n=1 Tax=Poseidonibacter sp. TaxID=2321188 RepID=UPI00359D193C